MNKRIEDYIPKAIAALENQKIVKNGSVPKEFNGYISSFGASVRQAGLLATILFYDNANSNAQEDRTKVIRALEQITSESLNKNTKTTPALRANVEDAAIALKLALRTFKLIKE
jgi:CRISPR-associated protein Cmr5